MTIASRPAQNADPSAQPDHQLPDQRVREVLLGRRSVRAFTSTKVEPALLRQILEDAARAAPSGTNTQPWRVHVATGRKRDALCAAVTQAARNGEVKEEYQYAPERWSEPYLGRRRQIGFALYELLGIARDDMEGRQRQSLRNFELFGAPVGLFFSVEKNLEKGSWLDLGLFMQSVMLVARVYGLETCPQASWLHYGQTVHSVLDIPGDEVIVSGMALGYEDKAAVENTLVSPRVPVDSFATFHHD